MLRGSIILFAFLGLASLARSETISETVASPYRLAKFVETHQDFDWDPIWRALKTDQAFLPRCEKVFEGVSPCSSELITVAGNPARIILILEENDSMFQVFLRYDSFGAGAWRFSGAFAPFVKYFRPEHRIRRVCTKPFLVVTSQGTAGTGQSSKIEYWVDLTRVQFKPVLNFTSEGHSLPPDGIGSEVNSFVVAVATQPVERISVALKVDFEEVQNYRVLRLLVGREDTVVYVRNGGGRFEIDRTESTATNEEVKRFYDADSFTDEEFLKFNIKALSDLAVTKGDARIPWLADLIRRNPNTPESRRLKALMLASTR